MRIKQIAEMVEKCNVVADIGTDHGYVPKLILNKNYCKKVIASDINIGPLNSAKKYIKSVGLEKYVDFRLGSGLKVLKPKEVDIVVIAGMGGLLINSIINESPEVSKDVKKFILQPMTAVDKVRKYLFYNNYKIECEKIVKEYHHYYHILKVVHGKDELEDEIYFEISKYLLENKDNLIGEYINKQIIIYKNIINNIKASSNVINEDNFKKIIVLTNKIDKYMELKKIYGII